MTDPDANAVEEIVSRLKPPGYRACCWYGGEKLYWSSSSAYGPLAWLPESEQAIICHFVEIDAIVSWLRGSSSMDIRKEAVLRW